MIRCVCACCSPGLFPRTCSNVLAVSVTSPASVRRHVGVRRPVTARVVHQRKALELTQKHLRHLLLLRRIRRPRCDGLVAVAAAVAAAAAAAVAA
eukprot:CAMPEP_0198686296 /NCGR_PEP_ID=MMETSP1468-20131203/14748_1 /TAXON_ID=1461545 /ORGANISM="Mantoniella sp, Strain CCMP1436" /LENGTH=94 /DNA_ID=CAMNT_0044432335 /DNA_START=48 /DNA_END=328 /DNA_ORIENTATION=+